MKLSATYQSILVICVGFLLLYLWLGHLWLLYIGLGVGVVSLLSHRVAELMVRGWEMLGRALGYVNSRIILSLIYVLIVLPMALFYRASRQKTLQMRRSGGSYWVTRDHPYRRQDLENPW